MSRHYVKRAAFLTPQQRKVLELIAAGLDHRQAADEMRISRQSFKKHIVNICDRFFARDEHFRAVIRSKLLEDKERTES